MLQYEFLAPPIWSSLVLVDYHFYTYLIQIVII